MLKEKDISQYQMTEHFIVRAYERFGIDSTRLKQWRENYRYLVETGLEASQPNRVMLVAEDGVTFIVDDSQKTLVTCYQGSSPLSALRMQYDLFRVQLETMMKAKLDIIKTYHRQHESVFDHLMQLHHDMVTDRFIDMEDYDETLKSIHHMQKRYYQDFKKVDAYIEKLQNTIDEFAREIVQLESLSNKSNPKRSLAVTERALKDEEETFPQDTTPMHWNPFEYFQLGDRNTSPIMESPLASEEVSNYLPAVIEDQHVIVTVKARTKNASYASLLTPEQLEEFREFIMKAYPQTQPNKQKIMNVIQSTAIEQVPGALKKIDGIGDSRKKQMIAKLEELLDES